MSRLNAKTMDQVQATPPGDSPQVVKRSRAEGGDVDARYSISKELDLDRDQDDTRRHIDQDVRDAPAIPAPTPPTAPAVSPAPSTVTPVSGTRVSPSSTSGAAKQQRRGAQEGPQPSSPDQTAFPIFQAQATTPSTDPRLVVLPPNPAFALPSPTLPNTPADIPTALAAAALPTHSEEAPLVTPPAAPTFATLAPPPTLQTAVRQAATAAAAAPASASTMASLAARLLASAGPAALGALAGDLSDFSAFSNYEHSDKENVTPIAPFPPLASPLSTQGCAAAAAAAVITPDPAAANQATHAAADLASAALAAATQAAFALAAAGRGMPTQPRTFAPPPTPVGTLLPTGTTASPAAGVLLATPPALVTSFDDGRVDGGGGGDGAAATEGGDAGIRAGDGGAAGCGTAADAGAPMDAWGDVFDDDATLVHGEDPHYDGFSEDESMVADALRDFPAHFFPRLVTEGGEGRGRGVTVDGGEVGAVGNAGAAATGAGEPGVPTTPTATPALITVSMRPEATKTQAAAEAMTPPVPTAQPGMGAITPQSALPALAPAAAAAAKEAPTAAAGEAGAVPSQPAAAPPAPSTSTAAEVAAPDAAAGGRKGGQRLPPASPHTLEEGRIFFMFRPKAKVLEVRGLKDVQRFDIVLQPLARAQQPPASPHTGAPAATDEDVRAGGVGGAGASNVSVNAAPELAAPSRPAVRRISVSKKHLPSVRRHDRFFAYVAAVGGSVEEVVEGSLPHGPPLMGATTPTTATHPTHRVDAPSVVGCPSGERCVGSGTYVLYTYQGGVSAGGGEPSRPTRGPSATRLAYVLDGAPDVAAGREGKGAAAAAAAGPAGPAAAIGGGGAGGISGVPSSPASPSLQQLGVGPRGVMVVSVKNPEFIGEEGAPSTGLNPHYSDQQVQLFKGERWGGAEDTTLLDEVGTELLLIGARPNPPQGTMQQAVEDVARARDVAQADAGAGGD